MLTIFGIVWWGFIAYAIISALFVTLVAFQRPFFALFIGLLATFAVTYLMGVPIDQMADVILSNALLVVSGLIVYLSVGLAYAYFVRWNMYISSDEAKQKIDRAWTEWATRWVPDATAGAGKSKREIVERTEQAFEDFYVSANYPFSFAKDFRRISNWVLWWPLDLAWILCHDFLEWIFKSVGTFVSEMFASSAKNAARNQVLNTKK